MPRSKARKTTVDVGFTMTMRRAPATRGERLALTRVRVSGQTPRRFKRRAQHRRDRRRRADRSDVVFDLDDFDAAIAELDARYLAGEAAAYSHTWSVMTDAFAAINRHELPKLTPDWVNIDHRRGAAFATGDMTAYIHALWDDAPDINVYIEVVHRLSNLGVVITQAAHGTSQQGFEAEWRENSVFTFDGDLLSRCEIFDDADLDAALAKFEELSRSAPQLENAAARAYERLRAHFAASDWEAMTAMLASDAVSDDRRRTANAGIRRGPEAAIQDAHAMTDLGFTDLTSTVIATRGERLVLMRARYSGPDRGDAAFYTEVLNLVEIGADDRIVGRVWFDPDDFDAAIAELDARYLASEGAAHAHVWSVIAGGFASMRRYELPPTTPDCVSIDHRRTAAFAPGELNAYFRAAFDLTADVKIYVEGVHRLNDLGVVCTHVVHGVSHEGFAAEWREVDVLMVEGNVVNRCEIFDESDIDAALAKFKELSPHDGRLKNAASQVLDRVNAYFAARDWAALRAMMATDVVDEDRRRVANAGVRQGRDAVVGGVQTAADLGAQHIASTAIATRGDRLALCRFRFSGRDQRPEAFYSEALGVVEIDVDERVLAHVALDVDDIDAAFEELDARYLAGEAAAHARTWSVITRGNTAANRNAALPMTPDSSMIDHRLRTTLNADGLTAYVRASWDLTPELHMFIESVHRLNDVGAVVTHASRGTSQDDFEAEWRQITLFMLEGDLCNRCEIFDEANLDAALARFDELQPQARRLENAASRVTERCRASLAARDWDAMTELLAEGFSSEDRRRVVNSGMRRGRDVGVKDMQAAVDVIGITYLTSVVIATRGERLELISARVGNDERHEAVQFEVLQVTEIDADERIAAVVTLDGDDIVAAFAELDARYLGGEAAAHAHTWSVIARTYAAFNQHEFPSTTPDPVYIDHRPGVSVDEVDVAASIRAVWDLTPDVRICIEAVHRLSELGAVVTAAMKGTSPEGFDAEWQMIDIFTAEGDRLRRIEVFDEADLDAALARFDELHPPTRRLENAATRADDRFFAYFAARNWAALAEILTDESFIDDRRPVVNAGLWDGRDAVIANLQAVAEAAANVTSIIATRGERLALTRIRSSNRDPRQGDFGVEILNIVEIDTDERIVAHVDYDADDIDAAFEELDARYLAGEAAAHARAWSVIAGAHAGFNRHKLPATTADPVYIDHRPLVSIEGADLAATLRAVWDITPAFSVYIEAVHRLANSEPSRPKC